MREGNELEDFRAQASPADDGGGRACLEERLLFVLETIAYATAQASMTLVVYYTCGVVL